MNRMNQIGLRGVACLAIFALIGISASPVLGQFGAPAPERRAKIFRLKNNAAPNIVNVLTNMFKKGELSIAVEERTNSIVLSCTEEQMKMVENLIHELDVPVPAQGADSQTPPRMLQVIRLKYGNFKLICDVLQVVLQRSEGLRITPDQKNNSLVLFCTEEELKVAREVIQKLDVPTPGAGTKVHSSPVDVRIIWLAEGEGITAKPADDLKGVVEELRRLGLNNVGQVAQALVKSNLSGRQFHISCSPLLDDQPTQLTADGVIAEDMTMEIRASVTRTRTGPGTEKLADLNVSTVFRPNEYLVLAVAPIGKITSVFVVQVIPSQEKGTPQQPLDAKPTPRR